MADPLLERAFAGYRVDGQVGRGGMGVVYRATDTALDRTVALKVLADDLAEDPAFRRRFIDECKIAASLDHPNIVPIYAAGEHDGRLYLAMRFVAGEDLHSVLRACRRIEPPRVAQIVGSVASALDAAHGRGLVHRDIKPANVLLSARDEHVYLTDFGLSKRVTTGTRFTRTGQILGTLDYIAPEQIRREPAGPGSDIYALGCMAFHLLTGEVPFPAETEEGKLWAQLSEPPPRASARVTGLDPAFDGIIRRAMHKDPARRYAKAGDLGRALSRAAGEAPATGFKTTRGRLSGWAADPVGAGSDEATETPREILVAALTEPFNLAVLAVLLLTGLIVGAPAATLLIALLVYAAAVARSYLDPATRDRVAQRAARRARMRAGGGPRW